MTLQDSSQFIKSLITDQSKKSEQKIYEEFIKLLSALEHHDLSGTEVLSIEKQLDALQLTRYPQNKKRFFKRKLHAFKSYLKTHHGLVNKGHYSSIGIAMGMSFGMISGLVFGDAFGIDNKLIIGMIFGMAFGIIIGKNKDAEAARQNRVLITI